MWASAHAQKMNITVSMVTAADTPIFRFFFRGFPCRIIEIPDNGGTDNRGSTVLPGKPPHDTLLVLHVVLVVCHVCTNKNGY